MSFSVGRGRVLNIGSIGVSDDELPPLDDGPINLYAWFNDNSNSCPLELEIGCGKGTFIVQQAVAVPNHNHIAIEYAKAFWRYAADRCRRQGLLNVRIIRCEAASFIRNYVPDSCLQQIHIYFPDPWPKKRHHKRRLIQEPFLRQAHRTLEASGVIRIATDHQGYYEWMVKHSTRTADLYERLPFSGPQSAVGGEWVGSNFERKYRREGRPFHGMNLRKI